MFFLIFIGDLLISVCNRWSGRDINSRRFPKLDQIEIGLSRAVGAVDRLCCLFVWFAQLNSSRNLLFSIDRSLCGIDFDYVFGIFPNHCDFMVLWCRTADEEYQTNDRQSTIVLLSFVLVGCCTASVVCKCLMRKRFLSHFDLTLT